MRFPKKTLLIIFFLAITACGCGGGSSSQYTPDSGNNEAPQPDEEAELTLEEEYPYNVLSDNGVESIRTAASIADTAQDAARSRLIEALTASITEQQVVDAVMAAVSAAGGVWCSNPVVATGDDALIAHGNPDNDSTRIVASNTIAIVDLTPGYNGYCADVARTYFLGEPSQEIKDAYAAHSAALQAGVGAAAPGASCATIYNTMIDTLESSGGFGDDSIPAIGHGLSADLHAGPLIHVDYDCVLQGNTVLALEPVIFIDGEYRIQIEDDVLITATGAVVLNNVSRDIEDVTLTSN